MQVAWALRFSTPDNEDNPPGNRDHLELSYGARFFRLQDNFNFGGYNPFVGDFSADTTLDNRSIGPLIGAKWGTQRRGWDVSAESSLLLGSNLGYGDQVGSVGKNLVPGGLNGLFFYSPSTFDNQQDINEFSPVGEFRAQASYQLSQTLAVRLDYTALYLGNIRYAEDSVVYRLPGMGLADNGTRDIFINSVYASVEFVH